MKKTLLSIITFGCAVFANAAIPEHSWNVLVDGPQGAGDNMYGITVTNDGNIVTVGNFGSRSTADTFTFKGQEIATGAKTDSASDNYNLLVTKHSSTDGSLLWALSTKNGDVASSGQNSVAATADGGVVLLVDMRSSNVTPYESPVIVDAAKTEIDFPDWNTSCWIKNQVVIKVSKDGYVQWVRRIVADQLPVPNASSGSSVTNTTNGAFPYAIAEDKDGNIYIAGNHRASLIFTGEQNSTYVLTPRNISTYNGDVQTYAGGLYLVKLDENGNYLTHLQGSVTDGITADYINSMEIDDDMIYFAGYFQGKEGSTLTLGKGANAKEVTKLNGNNAVLLGAVKTTVSGSTHSLVPQFLTCYNEANRTGSTSHRIQLLSLKKTGSSLYFMGSFQGAVSTNENDTPLISSAGTQLEGFIIKTDASDGSYQAGLANKISIGGYRNLFSYDNAIYAQGYRLNAATGAFIDRLDAETLEIQETTTVASGGGAPTLMAGAFNSAATRIYSAVRGNNTFTLTDQTTSEKPVSWGILLSCHVLDRNLAKVNDIKTESDILTVAAGEGYIELNATAPVDVTIADTKGAVIDSRKIAEGSTTVNLPAGIYIVDNNKVAVR
ncbi:MAG: hypothetical protein K2L85_01895 [Paramuribaculum sp.]|nr:hypothetical protein [Paramuribaculum sp.]